jgi:hypothetical protein
MPVVQAGGPLLVIRARRSRPRALLYSCAVLSPLRHGISLCRHLGDEPGEQEHGQRYRCDQDVNPGGGLGI